MSSQCGPTGGICRKWSITQMLVKPRVLGGHGQLGQPVPGLGGATREREAGASAVRTRGASVSLLLAGGRRRGGDQIGGDDGDVTGRVDGGEPVVRRARPARRASGRASTPSRWWGSTAVPGAVAGPARGGVGVEHHRHAWGAGVVGGPDPAPPALVVGAERVDDRGQPAAAGAARPRGRARRRRPSRPAGRARRPRRRPAGASDDTTWCGRELLGRPRRLARRGRPHEHHERALGQAERADGHRPPACLERGGDGPDARAPGENASSVASTSPSG